MIRGLRLTPFHIRWNLVPETVLLVTLLLTGVTTYYLEVSARAKDRLRFETATQRAQAAIEERLNTHIALLRAGRGFFYASEPVSLAEFRAFSDQIELRSQYPGIQGIGFSQRVAAADVDALVAEMQTEDNPTFALRPAAARDEYHVIVYLEPLDARNQAALGYDMFTEPVRRAAMARARDTAEPAMSGRVTLMQEIDEQKQAGFLIYLPVYAGKSPPETLIERRSTLQGFIYSPFRADDLMAGIFRPQPSYPVDFQIYDGIDVHPDTLLYCSGCTQGKEGGDHRPWFTKTAEIEVAGRIWTFVFTSNSALEQVSERRLIPFMALVGSTVSLALFGLIKAQSRARTTAEATAAKLREREDSFQALVANVPGVVYRYIPNRQGRDRFDFVSSGSLDLLEVEPDLLLKDMDVFLGLIHPEDLPSFQASVAHAAQYFLPWLWEGRIVTPSGQLKWVQGRSSSVNLSKAHVWDGLLIDITDRKQIEQELGQINQTLGTLVDASPLPIVVVDPDSTVRLWNVAAAELFGWSELEILGQPLPGVPDEKREECAQLRQAVAQGETFFSVETLRCHRDGTPIIVDVSAAPLRDENDSVAEIMLVFQDITQRKQVEAEREQLLQRERTARTEAETANRIKDEFLAVLSHELRSPLNPILGWTKLLQGGTLSEPASRQALATIERNAKLQAQLIEDLLDISRILQGKLALQISPVNLVHALEAALETVCLAAESKGIQVETDLSPEVGPVAGDAARLQQIVWNLLSNAVKFTPAGGRVEVRLAVVGTPAWPQAQIVVTDTGVGISPQFLPYVFDTFRQEDGKTTRRFGGLGLGLSIVRHLSELHGGTVSVSSEGEGLGATFTVTLPLMTVVPQPEPDGNPSGQQIDLSQLQILVVDDEADMRELLSAVLVAYGAQVTLAASAAEALALLDQFHPDVLVSDIGMPEMDGYMLMQQLRNRSAEQGGTIAAIALTAYAGELDQQRALAVGFQRHLAKPIEPELLAQAIAALLRSPSE